MRGLVGHVPPRIGIIEHANYARFVPDVARVVEGKKIAAVVESKLLGIGANHVHRSRNSTRRSHNGKPRHDRMLRAPCHARPRRKNHGHLRRKEDARRGRQRDSMEVVSDERNPDSETIDDFLVRVGYPVVIWIGKPAHGRDTGKEGCVSFS